MRLNRIFPAVNVYRGGLISELQSNPNSAIANYLVDAASGPMTNGGFMARLRDMARWRVRELR